MISVPRNRLFYVSTGLGVTLVVAEDEDSAEEKTLRKVGTYNGVQNCREATQGDIAYVKAMGGYVPQGF